MVVHQDVAGMVGKLRSDRSIGRAWQLEAADVIESLSKALSEAEDRAQYANGTADLAIKHRDVAESRLAEAMRLLTRYRGETPLGNQPHMVAHEADALINMSRLAWNIGDRA